jgi:hypothetical protein
MRSVTSGRTGRDRGECVERTKRSIPEDLRHLELQFAVGRVRKGLPIDRGRGLVEVYSSFQTLGENDIQQERNGKLVRMDYGETLRPKQCVRVFVYTIYESVSH